MIIPRNKHQERIHSDTLDKFKPDIYGYVPLPCVIKRVYTSEVVRSGEEIPTECASQLLANPGWVFAKVEVEGLNGYYYLPFECCEEELFANHGNHVLLEGRNATISYMSRDIHHGVISLTRTRKQLLLPLDKQAQVFDVFIATA